jgi:hypothetical protein
MPSPSTTTILCDAHVHIYDCFDLDFFFDSAWRNFYQQALSLESQTNFCAALLLSEAKQDHRFLYLKENKSPASNWSFHQTNEPVTLIAQHINGHKIHIINGRQIITSENFEVLALATTEVLADGEPISNVIDWVINKDAIPVIPWGFGKWWGIRGDILSDTLNHFTADKLFLGDNSGRPWCLRKPKHFEIAESEQRRILPGSDPLPFASETWRPGSVGFYFNGTFNEGTPAKCIRDHLNNPNATISTYMHRERLVPFIRNQLAMQIKKRM